VLGLLTLATAHRKQRVKFMVILKKALFAQKQLPLMISSNSMVKKALKSRENCAQKARTTLSKTAMWYTSYLMFNPQQLDQ
jgi:hypothetical protein